MTAPTMAISCQPTVITGRQARVVRRRVVRGIERFFIGFDHIGLLYTAKSRSIYRCRHYSSESKSRRGDPARNFNHRILPSMIRLHGRTIRVAHTRRVISGEGAGFGCPQPN